MESTPKSAMRIDSSVAVAMLRTMLRARLTEERLIKLYHQGKIFGGVYTGLGQEAIGTATAHASAPEDLFAPSIRDLTVHLGRGTTVLDVFRQYLGRATGPTGGRDGNVHHGSPQRGIYNMISHLGSMLPVLIGGVMARRRQGGATVGFGYAGDGATSTGDFHEAVNFAAVFDVPVLIVIENNHYAYSTPTRRQYRCERLCDRAIGYGIEGREADGNDVLRLHVLVREIVDEIRHRPRPVLLECDTMRMRGHGEHDDASYVPRELLAAYARRDPIKRHMGFLFQENILTEKDMERLQALCLEEVSQAYRQALAEPDPDPATLRDGVYADA
jgi:TPP-dependent pyruvate/acetoin dehydrogenase alpha subunit